MSADTVYNSPARLARLLKSGYSAKHTMASRVVGVQGHAVLLVREVLALIHFVITSANTDVISSRVSEAKTVRAHGISPTGWDSRWPNGLRPQPTANANDG